MNKKLIKYYKNTSNFVRSMLEYRRYFIIKILKGTCYEQEAYPFYDFIVISGSADGRFRQ